MTETPTITRGQSVAADVTALLRARNSLLWIVTREEARVERYLFEAAAAAGYNPHTWDVAQGICNISGKQEKISGNVVVDPGDMLNAINSRAQGTGTARDVWIMRDLPAWLNPPIGMTTLRLLRNVARLLPTVVRERAQAIIILTPSTEIPPELADQATVIEWPLPDRAEIANILDAAIEALPEADRKPAINGSREIAIDSAVGLSGEEAAACYARSLVQLRRIDAKIVAGEKKRIIAREGVLEWYDPIPGGMEAVGGLEHLKTWLAARRVAYTPEARAYGLPSPRGALIVGISGCGKSLTAKAIATNWQVPLLRIDLNALKSKWVGASEGNLRKALKVIEAIGRCVVWIDELEKALAGATQGAADGGVSADALGTILSWMQERQGAAFIIATANDVSTLPPELLRKGRWDDLWFVDVPTRRERQEVLAAALRQHDRDPATIDLPAVAEACPSFTGAEIAALVPDALFSAFADDARPLETRDLLAATKTVVPLTQTAGEKITALRAWAAGRARPASVRDDDAEETSTGRQLDI